MKIAAVILAGGKGERMGGVNKALLEIGGERFIDRAIAAATGCDPILVAVGRKSFALPVGVTAVFDLETDYAGPLAGVVAAVEHLDGGKADLLLSLAVDTPLFPRDFIARTAPLLRDAQVVVGAFGIQDYPTNALWRLDAIAELPNDARKGIAPRSLKRLAGSLRSARLDYAEFTAEDPFRNANTPEDLALLRRIQGSQNTA
jgi:molybdopterin-guanine dinucleotide biosynthesis protein A